MNININIHHHYHGKDDKTVEHKIDLLTTKTAHFMSNTSVTLEQLKAQLTRAYGEITSKIQALTDSVNNNQDNLSPESQAALADLQTLAQKLDDIVPDATTEPGGDTGDQTGGDTTGTTEQP